VSVEKLKCPAIVYMFYEVHVYYSRMYKFNVMYI